MKKWRKKYKIAVVITTSIVAIACITGYKEYTRKLPDTAKLKAAFALKAGDLINHFEADETDAMSKYSDQVLSVQGIINSVHATDSSGAVFLNDEGTTSSVMCQFDKKKFKEILYLHKGVSITIKGICSGYLMDVVLVHCVIE